MCVCFLPTRLEAELKTLQEQLSLAPKQHQLDTLQSGMSAAQSSLQEARSQLREREETVSRLQEQLVQVSACCLSRVHCDIYLATFTYSYMDTLYQEHMSRPYRLIT